VVIDKQTTVCSARSGNPLSISLGFTPLEGVMSRTSCGDLDPGVVFYLMNNQGFSIYKIDDILKNESGFLGLTGYDLELKELVKFYGKDRKVTLALIYTRPSC
jgi:acetate kinase